MHICIYTHIIKELLQRSQAPFFTYSQPFDMFFSFIRCALHLLWQVAAPSI